RRASPWFGVRSSAFGVSYKIPAMIRPLAAISVFFALLSAAPIAQDAFQQIKTEALERSQVMKYFDHLVLGIGPRLTGSPQHKAAADWSRETLASIGLEHA